MPFKAASLAWEPLGQNRRILGKTVHHLLPSVDTNRMLRDAYKVELKPQYFFPLGWV